jgi:hypothetical protein
VTPDSNFAQGGGKPRDGAARAAVSGSFRRFMSAVVDSVYELTDRGVDVLSPADPRVVDQFGDFLFVASDYTRLLRVVQDRHLAAIAAADFVWLVTPDGYIGQSAAMEIGFARAVETPIYSTVVPSDLTLRQYVSIVRGMGEAIEAAVDRRSTVLTFEQRVLLNPHEVIETAHSQHDAHAWS